MLGNIKHKKTWYYVLMVWFIGISGLQYMVGSDMSYYFEEYRKMPQALSLDILINGIEERRQPGWVIYCWLFRQISSDFTLAKLVQAIIFNVSVFSFFKRESKYMFLCVFFYAVSDYLVTNFNILRQSFSIAFGLYAFTAIKDEKYFKYGIFTLLAYLFHSSAILLLIMPIFKFVKSSKYTVGIALAVLFIGVYFLFKIDMSYLANDVLSNGMMGESGSNMIENYINNDEKGAREGAKYTLHALIVGIIVLYYLIKKKDLFLGGYGIFFLFCLFLDTMMPILWRFRLYFSFPYYIILAQLIVEFPLKRLRQIRFVFYVAAIIIYMYFPMGNYLRKYPGASLRYIDQYYPYHSIFAPQKEKRE